MEWIERKNALPEPEPHRNIEIRFMDAAGKEHIAKVSSQLVCVCDCTHWREIEFDWTIKE